MFDNSIYDDTLSALARFEFTEFGVDFKKSIIIDTAYCIGTDRASKNSIWKSLLKITAPLQCDHFMKVFDANRVLFTNWNDRKDYNELVSTISKEVSNSNYSLIKELFKRKNRLPRLYYIRIWCMISKCNVNIKTKIYLLSRLIDYITAIETLDKQVNGRLLKGYKYVPFNSSYGIENAITQYLNSRGCETFHLCHGLHFSPNYLFFSVDAFNKYLISAKTVLSWGQGFVENDKNRSNNSSTYKHVIAGNPKYPHKKIVVQFHKKSCIVFLARGQYDSNNEKLLDLLYRFSQTNKIDIYIKPHPTDNMGRIETLCSSYGFTFVKDLTIKELLSEEGKFGFAISYESTAYFEAMYYNLICFRYSYEENESYGDFDDRFNSSSELEEQLEKYSLFDLKKLSDMISETLRYEIGFGINNYKSILEK